MQNLSEDDISQLGEYNTEELITEVDRRLKEENKNNNDQLEGTDKYLFCNHHHVLSDDYQIIDFGDGKFVANNKAIPLLKALNDLGLRTRTHHVDENGGFVGILIHENMKVEIRQINERDSTRTKYNGMTEILIDWCNI